MNKRTRMVICFLPIALIIASGISERRGTYMASVSFNAFNSFFIAEAIADNTTGCPNDNDCDGIENSLDNCPEVKNPGQQDKDSDGVGNKCDNCPSDKNPEQVNTDGDAMGDICDPDDDNDRILDKFDNCPTISNPDQTNSDTDGLGNACDNCPEVNNDDQADSEGGKLEVRPGETMALWRLNEEGGSFITDESGNMSDGIINGGVIWTAGKYEKALSFDGIDDYVRIPDPEGRLDLSDNYTIEFYIKPDEIKAGTIILKFGGGRVLYIGVDYTGSLTIFNYDGSNACSITSSNKLQINSWYYIAVIKNIHYQEVSLYLNGEIDTQTPCLVADQTTTTDLYLGGSGGSYLKGALDEIRILNHGLFPEEISADFSDMPDGVGDACDNCRWVLNITQENNDGDGLGNACDPDDDNDGYSD
ncbi:MAG: thrombospondin type 3 repeat-containing protein, partial [Deltaproteobacteria bacterium]